MTIVTHSNTKLVLALLLSSLQLSADSKMYSKLSHSLPSIKSLAKMLAPCGDRAEYTKERYKRSDDAWFWFKRDQEGSKFGLDFLARMKLDKAGSPFAVRSADSAAQDRVRAIRTRLGSGRVGTAAVGVSNFMNKHYRIGNAIKYPALAVAAYYTTKAGRWAWNKMSALFSEQEYSPSVATMVIDKASKLVSTPEQDASLEGLVNSDQYLMNRIGGLAQDQKTKLNDAIHLFDSAFSLRNAQLRSQAISKALDSIVDIVE